MLAPKRLLIGIFIALWIAASLASILYSRDMPGPPVPYFGLMTPVQMEALWAFIFIFLSLGSLAVLYSSLSEGLLVFSIPEIDFLFSTPINKRLVLLTKLLRDHLKAGIWTAFFILLLSRTIRLATMAKFFPDIFFMWLALVLLWTFVAHTAHTMNIIATFRFAGLRYAKASVKIVCAGLAAALIISALSFSRWPLPASYFNVHFLSKVFFPIKWATNVIMAPVWGVVNETLLNIAGLLAISTGTMVVLLSLRYNIYEPSLSVSAKTARMRRAIRNSGLAAIKAEQIRESTGKGKTAFSIPMFGKGASVLLWKNLTVRLRAAAFPTFTVLLLPPVACLAAVKAIPDQISGIDGRIPFGILFYLMWIVSWTALKEIRSELRQTAILKAMPFSAYETVFFLSSGAAVLPVLLVLSGTLSIWTILPNTDANFAIAALLGLPAFALASVSSAMTISLLYPNMRDIVQGFSASWAALILNGILLAPSAVLTALGMVFSVNPLMIGMSLLVLNIGAYSLLCIIGASLFRKFDPESD